MDTFIEGFIVLFFKKKKKMSRKLLYGEPQGIVAGTGAGTGRQILFPGEWGAEKWPGTSGNGFPGFPVASLLPTSVRSYGTAYREGWHY